MHLRHLGVNDFRSWPAAELVLRPGVTVLLGSNGHGKTNLVEAIGYLGTLASHRVSTDAPLVRTGAERALVRAAVVNDNRELQVEVVINPGRANQARINRSPTSRPRDVLGILRTVLFAPEDLALVRGDPGERRRFLDELLVTRRPRMAAVRVDYEKVLRQRSALLKTIGAATRRGGASRSSGDNAAMSTLDVWDGHLATHGAALLAGRLDLVSELAPWVSEAYASVAPESRRAALRYRSTLGDIFPAEYGLPGAAPVDPELLEACMLSELSRMRNQELDRGMCLVGPHRDDVELTLGSHPAKGYASHGESWSFALALRLGSFTLLRSAGTDPVLVLDDVFAELDRPRRQALATVASGAEQVIMTAAAVEDVPAELDGDRFQVQAGDTDQGRVSEVHRVEP